MAEGRNLDNWKDMPIPAPQEDEYQEAGWGKACDELLWFHFFALSGEVGYHVQFKMR